MGILIDGFPLRINLRLDSKTRVDSCAKELVDLKSDTDACTIEFCLCMLALHLLIRYLVSWLYAQDFKAS